MVRWQLHDLELGSLGLSRCLNCNRGDYGCGCIRFANGYARGEPRVSVREQFLRRILCTRAKFLVLSNLWH